MLAGASCATFAAGGPGGGQIVSGVGSISESGVTTTIQQSSQTLRLNWQSFNVDAAHTVDFVQPGRNALAVNRIQSSTPSAIFGRLNANGQVWLINPNGVLFGPSAQVNVGGIVASTLDVDANTLSGNTRTFSGAGRGSIVNQGSIVAADGGYVALLGNRVSNQGVVSARLGTVALAGGSAATLTFDGSRLLHVEVDASTLGNLAENRQLLVADGGQVVMTAGAKNELLASVVNNTGEVRARTVGEQQGKIVLLGGMQAGQVNVGGTLDASAPEGGDGGSIETSAAHFNLAPDAHITAAAPDGHAGNWLVDPTNLTIDATTASTVSNTLQGGTSVTEQTTATGATGPGVQSSGAGDININAPVTWTNAAANFTLQALNAINVNAAVNGAGNVTMQAGTGNLSIAPGASVTGGAGVVLATSANFVNNAGSAAVSTGTAAPWRIYSTDPRLDTAGGLAPAFIQYNAPFQTAAAASGNGFLYSLAPTITVTGLTGTISKVYDGTSAAPLTGANLNASGLINGNTIQSATGTYATPNAGTTIRVSSPAASAGVVVTDASGKIPVFGYALAGAVTADIGIITPAPLAATIVGDPTKVYDGSASASLAAANYGLTGFVAGQGATVNQASSVSYATGDAGAAIPVNATFASTSFVANSGTSLSNYKLPTSATGMGTITPAPLIVTGLLANNKVYDGTSSDVLTVNGASIFGVISTDVGQVTLNTAGATGVFATSNAGSNIAVSAAGLTLTGARASNYSIAPSTNLAANITPKAITVSGVTANSKVYDATTAASLNLGSAAITGLVPADAANVTLSTGAAKGAFSQSNVGNALTVSATGFALAGSAAGNYSVSALTGITANITPAPLTISLLGAPSKVYDGSANATLTASDYAISGFVAGQNATVAQSSAQYATANAGNGITVTATLEASDFAPAAGTSMSNYSFPATRTTTSGVIRPAPVTVNIIGNPTKVFDGNANATLSAGNYAVSGAIPGQSISLNGASTSALYASANAGFQGVSATLGGANYVAGPGTLLSNYLLPTSASGMGTITQKVISTGLTSAITNNPTKLYDGTTVANIPANDFTLTGFVGTDSATVTQTVTGQYASKNAGPQPVQATLTTSELSAGPGTNLNNYVFPVTAFGNGTILPAPLAVSIVGNPTKVYNGNATANISSGNFQLNGFVAGEGATITPTTQFSYAQANAGASTISGALVSGNYAANANTLLSNYVLPTMASGPGIITPAPLYIINTYATNKVYDTTSADTLDTSRSTLSGLVAADAGKVTLNTSTTGTFAQSNAGSNIAVTASGFGISGSAAGNYALQPLTGLVANITPAQLTVGGAVANSKVYDGTTTATIDNSKVTLSGVLGSDNVTLTGESATGRFITSNVGNNLSVTSSGYALSGAQAGNYTLTQPAGLFANITPAPLNVVISGNPVKGYDGTTSVRLGSADFTVTGFVGNQSGQVAQAASSGYLSPNAGVNVGLSATLEPSDYVAGAGTNLSNYRLPTSATGTLGQITPKIIDLTGSRVYDGTTNANAALFTNAGTVAGINGQTLSLSGAGTLASKNVGSQVAFTAGTLALGNGTGLASNYTLAGGIDWVTITPATLTVIGTIASSRVYDGTTADALQGAQLSGAIAGDDVVLGNAATGSFANKNAGTGKAVSTNMSVSGADAVNYKLVQPTGLTANITPLAITVNATGNNKAYDATTAANVNLTSTGVLAGDNIVFTDTTANFAQANVGNNIAIAVLGIGATGTDAGNYALLNPTAATSANITPFVLNLQGTRVYDTTTSAAASLFGNKGTLTGVAGQTLTLGGAGTLASKTAGTQKAFASNGLSGFTLTGNGAALASNYTLTGGTDWVTVTRAPLTVTGTSALSKTYNGTTAAQLQGATLVGVLGADAVTLGNTATGTFNNKNVGQAKPVTASMTLSGADAANYALTQPAGLTANITPLGITVNAAGISKVYDGTTTARVTFTSPGLVSGDKVTFTDTAATFAQSNVGTNVPVSVAGIGATGTDAANYTLLNSTASATANITPFVLNLSGTRVYDARTDANASLFGSNGLLTGVAGQTLTLSGTGVLSTKNVGTQQAFASNGLSGFTLTGNGTALASNYTLTGGKDGVTVVPATLAVTGTTVNTKVYDATTAASLSGATLAGVLGTDAVTLGTAGTGTFNNKNVGAGKPVTPATMTISGTDAANYVLVQPTGLSGTVTPRPVTVSATGQNKTYDGTPNATVTLAQSGVIAGDSVSFGYGGASFGTSNAGTGIGIQVSGITGSGADAGNYAFNTTAGASANILPVVLNLTGTRVYDGTTGAISTLFGNSGVLNGVAGQTLTLSGAGSLSTKNVGTQQPLATNGLTLTGNGAALASNYTFAGGIDWVTVTPLPITVNAIAQNKTYDATTAANVALNSTGVLAGDIVTFGDTSANFTTPNAGSAVPVTVAGITASGADARNYSFATTATTSATISPVVLNLTGTRVYDGTTGAASTLFGSNGVLNGVAGQTLTVSGAGTLPTKNVGTQQPLATSGLTLTGNGAALASNYTFAGGIDWVTVTPLAVTIGAIGQNKTYDATTNAQVALSEKGVLAGDNVAFDYASANFNTPNAGANIPVQVSGITASGADARNYSFSTNATTIATISRVVLNLTGTRVYDGTTGAGSALFGNNSVLDGIAGQTLTLSGAGTLSTKNVGTQKPLTTNGLTLTGNGAALASNYTLTGGIDWVTVTPLAITVGAIGQNKTYDATTNAQVALNQTGVLAGDNVSFNYASANFTTPNAGTNIPVQVSGITASGSDAANYTINATTSTAANIAPVVLNLTGTRVYDGTTGAVSTLFGDNGVLNGVAGQTLTVSGAGTLPTKNVGAQQPLATNGLTLTGNGAALASNYTLAGGIDWVTVTPLAITISAIGQNKTYDATTNAKVALNEQGVLAGDNVAFDYSSANFNTPNAGANIPVQVSGITASGADAVNYSFLSNATASATIAPAMLNLTGTRVYDGTAGAVSTLFGDNGVLNGVAGQTLTVSGSGTLPTKNVGTQQPLTTNGFTLTGNGAALASNYTLAGGIDWVTVTPLAITISAIGQNKTYDATTNAQVALNETGVLAGDNIAFNYASANFTTPNAGTNIPVQVAGITASGNDASNYTINAATTTTANIAPVVLNLTGTRVYDGTAGANANLFGTNGVLNGIAGQTLTLSGAGTLSTKNVGTQQPLATNGLTLTGNGAALASNYTLAGGIDWVTVTPLAITLTATGQNKTYDATTNAQVALNEQGVLAGDNVSFNYASADFTTPNAGTNIPVQVAGITASGNDASNYTINATASTTANIAPVVLNLTGTRVYDGTTGANANLFGTNGVLDGIAGQTLTLSGAGTLPSKNVGTEQPLATDGFTLTGNGAALAGNYTFAGGIDWVTVTPKPIVISFTPLSKTYDGTTAAQFTGLHIQGLLGGDAATVTANGATFSSPNVGGGNIVALTGITASGIGLGNYTFSTTASAPAQILPVVLNLTGTRVYDGTTVAASTLFGNNGVINGVAGQTLTVSGAGTLSTKNVGTQQPLATNGLTLTGNGSAQAGNYTLAGGIDWVTVPPLAINVSATAANKVYDGTRAASVDLSGNGVLKGDDVSFSAQSASFASPNAGNGIDVAVTGIQGSGAAAGNYTFNSTATASANITPVVLGLTGSRVYDATTGVSAGLFGANGVLNGINGETVTLSGSGVLASKNVGNQINFTTGTLTLANGSGLASNYTPAGGIDWLTITPATLHVVGTQATSRLYDGSIADTLSGATLTGVLGSDQVTLVNGTSGAFHDPVIGNGKPVSTAMSIDGTDAGNYVLVQPSALSADITAQAVPITTVPVGTFASTQALVGANGVATPYGTAPAGSPGDTTGNQKQEDTPGERNVARSDFNPGLALTVINGGIRLPAN